ncbi:hypothetical protein L6164_025874 [Bauhinia variegata]|uniref:Uncharacterized protein n=1 Tax=Bauhinia variegata TaxID=167791 RepID=A0ACB9M5J4_BAUVA|nr:hypothetical protein L6164_025874 [Bauhinia variegata]
MNHNGRKILPPGGTRKRKEIEGEAFNYAKAKPSNQSASPAPEPSSSNRLLAGYMAYEFLTKGTLFGQKFDPAQAEAVPVAGSSSSSDQSKRMKPLPQQAEAATIAKESSLRKEHHSYAMVANLLKTEEVHIPGIVNPTQLSHWIEM